MIRKQTGIQNEEWDSKADEVTCPGLSQEEERAGSPSRRESRSPEGGSALVTMLQESKI